MRAFRRHRRFAIALICGVVAFLAAMVLRLPAQLLIGGDIFYVVFLALSLGIAWRIGVDEFARRAGASDEGMAVVAAIIIATMLYFMVAVFEALNRGHGAEWAGLLLAGIGAPLGWLVLHTAMAFHYADIHYFDDPDAVNDERGDLDFPGGRDPGPWDFLYFSFVIGMTCQVSDVQVKTTAMRKTVMWHGLISFFFNTVFIAMAVNAAVAMAA